MPNQVASGSSPKRATPDPEPLVLGRRLRTAQERGNFIAYCARVGVHSRKAYDLVAIANAVDDALLTATDVRDLGWSKARLIATQANTKRSARLAVAFARVNTVAALAAYFQTNGPPTKLVTKSFHLTPEEAGELDTALLLSGGQKRGGRFVNRSEALMALIRKSTPPVAASPIRKTTRS